MSDQTGIEWTDATWNPVTGCTEVSPGCDHCYARVFAERWRGVPGHHFERGFDVTLREDKLGLPLRWRAPRRVFVNSMSDLWHSAVPDEFIAAVWVRMLWTSPTGHAYRRPNAPCHTYQLLTKRPGRMRSWVRHWGDADRRRAWIGAAVDRGWCHPRDAVESPRWPAVLPNVWLGVSTETQKHANLRIPTLLNTPAAVRFVSAEPLLGPLDLAGWLACDHASHSGTGRPGEWECDRCGHRQREVPDPHGPTRVYRLGHGCRRVRIDQTRRGRLLDWVIAGGESGPSARPMHPAWARGLRDQCQTAQVPFLFKQWGTWRPAAIHHRPARRVGYREIDPGGQPMVRVGKHAAGRVLDGRTWDEFPTPTEGLA